MSAPAINPSRLKALWTIALLGGLGVGLWSGSFALSYSGLNAGLLVAAVIALGLGFYARALLLTGLVWLFARPLLSHFGETEVDREGDSVRVAPDWRPSGDETLDGYLASFAGAYAITIKSLVWVLIILTVTAIAWIASLFGLVDFSLW